jgi:hypothetical protein
MVDSGPSAGCEEPQHSLGKLLSARGRLSFDGRFSGFPRPLWPRRQHHLPENASNQTFRLLDAGVPSLLHQEARTDAGNRSPHPARASEDANIRIRDTRGAGTNLLD